MIWGEFRNILTSISPHVPSKPVETALRFLTWGRRCQESDTISSQRALCSSYQVFDIRTLHDHMDMVSRGQIDIEVEDWILHNCPPLCDQDAKRPRPKPWVECRMLINQDLHSFARSLCSRCSLQCLGCQVSHVSPELKFGSSNDTTGLHMSCEQKTWLGGLAMTSRPSFQRCAGQN